MRKLTPFLIISIFAIFQATILNYLKIFYVLPDLLLISMVMVSLLFELRLALVLSAFAGILKDIFSIKPFAINTILFLLWCLFIKNLSKKLAIENRLSRALLVFVIVIFNDVINRLVIFHTGETIPAGIVLRVIFLESLFSACVSPLVYWGICDEK